ncbi:MAG: DUF4402 domain-containing protein [Pseudomonadota bacterium]
MQFKKVTASIAIVTVFGTSINAFANSATFEASANIVEALVLAKNTDLAFANIVPSAIDPGTVVVSPAGARNCAAALSCSGIVSAADFSISGAPGATFTVTLPAAADISTSGGATMEVNNFTNSLVGNTGTLTGGNGTFQLGGTLNVGAAQAVGTYTGTFTVNVEYN